MKNNGVVLVQNRLSFLPVGGEIVYVNGEENTRIRQILELIACGLLDSGQTTPVLSPVSPVNKLI